MTLHMRIADEQANFILDFVVITTPSQELLRASQSHHSNRRGKYAPSDSEAARVRPRSVAPDPKG
jgi:hypothetical protein